MAHRLLNQGVAVIAWDRQPDHVQPLAERGAEVARTVAEVVSSARAVITMLPTAEVVEPLLDEWPEETIWLQMSSVGAAETDQLAEVANAHGVTLFDASVSGSTHPAEEGQLTTSPRDQTPLATRSSRWSMRSARGSSGSGREAWARA